MLVFIATSIIEQLKPQRDGILLYLNQVTNPKASIFVNRRNGSCSLFVISWYVCLRYCFIKDPISIVYKKKRHSSDSDMSVMIAYLTAVGRRGSLQGTGHLW